MSTRKQTTNAARRAAFTFLCGGVYHTKNTCCLSRPMPGYTDRATAIFTRYNAPVVLRFGVAEDYIVQPLAGRMCPPPNEYVASMGKLIFITPFCKTKNDALFIKDFLSFVSSDTFHIDMAVTLDGTRIHTLVQSESFPYGSTFYMPGVSFPIMARPFNEAMEQLKED